MCSLDAEPGWQGTPHKHDREEVVLVVAGSGTAVLDDESYEIAAGDTVIVPADVVHSFTAGPSGIACITCEPTGIRFFDPNGNEQEVPWTMR